MSSELKTNKISPATGTALQIGDSGDTITIPSGATLTNNGSSSGFDAGLASVQTFTSSGTWTRPTGITKVIVEVQGAGGSGSKLNGSSASPGAAGGYAKKLIDVSSISSSTVTIGTGGAAKTSDGNGNSGGSSSWADGTNTITCTGGSGGSNSTSLTSTVGGSATGGDINIPGKDSNFARSNGSDSMLGFGGPDSEATANFTGGSSPNARGYGAGGSATYTGTSGTGGDGIIIVWEYK